MKRRFSIPTQLILGLIVIGLLSSIIRSPSSYLIPLFIFAAIFILYKYPPNRFIHRGSSKTTYTYQNKPREKKKPSPFRVIQGNKDSSDDDDTPKFH
ncbi:MAG: hypothetical protein WD469_11955 [Paenibacillaceae bacterium]